MPQTTAASAPPAAFGRRGSAQPQRWDQRADDADQANDIPLPVETGTHAGSEGGRRALTYVMGFAAAALLAAAILPPLLQDASERYSAARHRVDPITTAGVPASDGTRRYTIRRSVLQAPGSAPCIVHPTGRMEGDC